MTKLKGQCMCGAVTVEADAARDGVTACHCDMCRRWTGGVNFTFEVVIDAAVIDGPVKTIAPLPWAERGFCANCGSNILYRVTAEGELQGMLKLSAGLFENAAGLPLEVEFYADERPEGYDLSKPHKTMTRAEVEAHFFSTG